MITDIKPGDLIYGPDYGINFENDHWLGLVVSTTEKIKRSTEPVALVLMQSGHTQKWSLIYLEKHWTRL